MNKTIPILLVVGAAFAIYLEAHDRLAPAVDALASPPQTQTVGLATFSLAEVVLAIIVFVVILSFLPEKAAVALTLIVVLGALVVNAKQQGSNGVLQQIFKFDWITGASNPPGSTSGLTGPIGNGSGLPQITGTPGFPF